MVYDADTLPKRTRRLIMIDPVTGCWLWQGRLDKDGYGPHRAIYMKLADDIPPGLECDHRQDWGCVSRSCVNPAHIKITTHRENTLRSTSFSALNARKTRCDHGHEFTPANTYRHRGRRDCRACGSDRARRYKRRLRDDEHGQTLRQAA